MMVRIQLVQLDVVVLFLSTSDIFVYEGTVDNGKTIEPLMLRGLATVSHYRWDEDRSKSTCAAFWMD